MEYAFRPTPWISSTSAASPASPPSSAATRTPQPSSAAVVRAFAPDDVDEVAALHGRIFGRSGAFTPAAMAQYFRDILFGNPWYDPAMPSLVAMEGGRATGFLGVVPRPIEYRGRRMMAAVCTQFMMDPGARSGMGAFHLGKAFFAGPQDLTIADGANDSARRLWTAIGGSPALLYSMHWSRPLRPAACLLSLLQRRAALRPLTLAARPLGRAADALAARLHPQLFNKPDAAHRDHDISAAQMLDHLPQVMRGRALQQVYDPGTLAWVLEQAAQKRRHGRLRSRGVSDAAGRLAGWYLYYCRPGGRAEVVQLAAAHGKAGTVIDRLFADAWSQGAVSLHGRMEPQFAQELSARHCWFRSDGPWTLIHSRHQDLAAALHRGDAFFSRLDAEWWMRFVDG